MKPITLEFAYFWYEVVMNDSPATARAIWLDLNYTLLKYKGGWKR